MKIARARLWRVRFRLRSPVATARGWIDVREGALLALETDSALLGHGEALPLAGFGAESPERSFETLSGLARVLLGREVEDFDALLDLVEELAPEAPAARAAVDFALFDLAAQAESTSVAALLARPSAPRSHTAVSALLSGEAPEAIARAASAAVGEGFRTVKIKLGAQELDRDEARVAAVREAVGSETRIRLDANGGWKEREAEQAIARLARYRIELLEQPVEARELAALARLSANSPILLAADEALGAGFAIEEIFERDAARVLVLKPGALGGLRACWKIAARARERGWGSVVTSGFDSALGLAAALQLAVALPDSPFAAGLATGAMFERDLAPPPLPVRGELRLPDAPGIGVVPERARLALCALGSALEIRA